MLIQTIDYFSEPGKNDKQNEDLIVEQPNAILLLDGATGLANQELVNEIPDAYWFVTTIKHYFCNYWHCSGQFKMALANAVADTHEEFKNLCNINDKARFNLPSAGLVAMTVENNKLWAYHMGDCSIVETTSPTYKLFHKPEIAKLDQIAINELTNYLNKGYSVNKAREKITPLLRQHRNLINQPNGYVALSLDCNPYHFMDCLDLTPYLISTGEASFVLMSDGFSAVFDTFQISSYYELTKTNKPSLKQIASDLRVEEDCDPSLHQFPRLKVHDDTTAIHVKVNSD